MTNEVNAERLTKIYVKIREKRRELAKQDKELEEQLAEVSSALLEICKEQGAATIRTEHGTISRRISKRYWTNDWGSFFNFIKEHDAVHLLERRVHSTHMKQFLEENPDLLPIGLQVDSRYTVRVRKASSK